MIEQVLCHGVDIGMLEQNVKNEPNGQGGQDADVQTHDARANKEKRAENGVFEIVKVVDYLG